jgi:hypothetical protein
MQRKIYRNEENKNTKGKEKKTNKINRGKFIKYTRMQNNGSI